MAKDKKIIKPIKPEQATATFWLAFYKATKEDPYLTLEQYLLRNW